MPAADRSDLQREEGVQASYGLGPCLLRNDARGEQPRGLSGAEHLRDLGARQVAASSQLSDLMAPNGAAAREATRAGPRPDPPWSAEPFRCSRRRSPQERRDRQKNQWTHVRRGSVVTVRQGPLKQGLRQGCAGCDAMAARAGPTVRCWPGSTGSRAPDLARPLGSPIGRRPGRGGASCAIDVGDRARVGRSRRQRGVLAGRCGGIEGGTRVA